MFPPTAPTVRASNVFSAMRAPLACAALAMLLAGCAAAGPAPASLDANQDLFQALPPPSTLPSVTATPTVTPSATATPTRSPSPAPTRKATPKPAAPKPAAVPVAAPDPQAAVDARWRRVGGDEFDAGALDTGKWNAYDGAGGFGNGRRTPEAISQGDGKLRISASGKDGGSSGGMADSAGQLHGRWEFRARTDNGRGFGSAILLWPDSENFPVDGEIDIMEVPDESRNLAHFVLHWGEANNVHGGAVPGDYTTWHTFAVEWLPDRITWFVDGVKQYETTDLERIPTKPMHLTIQLDQGPKKDWIEAPDETTPEQIQLEVDWVRVYELAT